MLLGSQTLLGATETYQSVTVLRTVECGGLSAAHGNSKAHPQIDLSCLCTQQTARRPEELKYSVVADPLFTRPDPSLSWVLT